MLAKSDAPYVKVDASTSSVTFTIQNGPIKEVGVNGCQIDDVISWCRDTMLMFNTAFPCRENALCITKLEEALHWLAHRHMDRVQRGVEGHNKA